jgi:cellobiose phosphorylase
MESAYRQLVNEVDGIIQLFNPAFDKSVLNPGYIKGYLPGVRENGGQYTHAAVWLAMAFAEMGNTEKTYALVQMLNPIMHGNESKKMERYEVEPYILAADVYTVPERIGRGGWTWYTGSAGWMYQLLIRYFLGLRREGNRLRFSPCVPDAWDSFSITYKFERTTYKIGFFKKGDYPPAREASIELQDDGNDKELRLLL